MEVCCCCCCLNSLWLVHSWGHFCDRDPGLNLLEYCNSICVLVEFPLKVKNVVRSRNSSSSNIWSGNRFVRYWRVVSLLSRSLMTRRASVIGMLVYRDSTSKDTMISSGSMVCCRMNCEKSLEFLQCCWLSLV